MPEYPVVIIGAGPSGISAALSLRDRGVEPVIVDRAAQVASSWRTRYDRLKLNTGRQFSHLPGRRYPRGTPTFPTRDQFVDHLALHARGLQLRFNTAVQRIDHRPPGWRLTTSAGVIGARHVVVATGFEHTPCVPEWPGAQGFTGDVLHSSQYCNPTRYVGKRVLVVGAGSSGMEIAHDLATGGAAKVWLAVRTPPNIIVRTGPLGLPGDAIGTPLYHLPPAIADKIVHAVRLRVLGDLTKFGLPLPDEGPFTRLHRRGVAPAIIDMEVIDAIKDGRIEVVKTPQSFDGNTVSVVGGARLQPDAVICATGYLRGLEPLVGHLGVLDEHGAPRARSGETAADGLWFLGYLSRPSLIGYVAKRSRRMAEGIADELKASRRVAAPAT
ncbi:flavin-containing monooxygenase [Mycobacterium seoulense]|uniref:flavin-containing monooxygenase n=1 Tax=Mycobacterium seoulense TaxID=386911 RepID=UPI003CF516B8